MCTLRLLVILGGFLFLAPAVTTARVTYFTDSSGKVHITNQEADQSEPPNPQPIIDNPKGWIKLRKRSPALPPSPPPAENELPEEPAPTQPDNRGISGRQSASAQETGVKYTPVTYEQNTPTQTRTRGVAKQTPQTRKTEPRSMTQVAQPARRPAVTAFDGSIQISRNKQGVLCITNFPEEEPSSSVTVAETRALRQASLAQADYSPVSWQDSPLTGHIIPAAINKKSDISFSTALEEGPIRRNRDKKGVVRITNVVLTARKTNGPTVAAIHLGMREGLASPLTTGQPPPPEPGRAPSDMSKAEVVVRRDNRGRLHIYTKEPEKPILAHMPSPPALDKIDPALAPIVAEAANSYRLPVSLILAVIRLESNFSPRAVSPKGAMGLMQLMPGTAADLGVEDPFCPRENIMAGSRYLRHLLNCFNGSLPLAVAAYNSGQQRVVQAGYQIPEIKETKEFVSQVIGLHCLQEKMSLVRRP